MAGVGADATAAGGDGDSVTGLQPVTESPSGGRWLGGALSDHCLHVLTKDRNIQTEVLKFNYSFSSYRTVLLAPIYFLFNTSLITKKKIMEDYLFYISE
jgi:hypothetical protein